MSTSERISFRRRLLSTTGVALAGTFLLLGAVAWGVVYTWLNHDANTLLAVEAREVASHIVSAAGDLQPDQYGWYEPHHRFADQRIDPYFLQVFDAEGALRHTSENIGAFPPGTFPTHLLHPNTAADGLFQPIRPLSVGTADLYYLTLPLDDAEQERPLGYIQVARFAPALESQMVQVTLLLFVGLGTLLVLLLSLLTWSANRVIRPLASITAATQAISPTDLSTRFAIPPEADRETAQLAQTLNALLGRLEASFTEMERFTANAAHELQTPLTILRGHVEVTLRRARTPEAYAQTFQLLSDEINQIIEMVRSLLTLTRLAHPHAAPAHRTDLAALLQEEAPRFAARAHDKNLAFHVDAPDSAVLDGQPELLREVIANLLDNAVKYTEQGRIDVRLCTVGDALRLTVADTGLGISAADLPLVTDRFFRAASVQSQPGHGLGLALVHQIVRRHQGTVRVRSALGSGTEVEVSLPSR